jgi:hypothetical protein
MKNGALFLLIILLLSLVLCSLLGGNNCLKEGFGSGMFADKISSRTGVSTTTETPTTDSSTSVEDTNSNESTESSSSSLDNSYTINYDNYNHNTRTSYPTKFYGPNGGTASIRNENGNFSLLITNSNGTTTLYTTAGSTNTTTTPPKITEKIFYGPNGGTARIFMSSDGDYVIEITDANGVKTAYSSNMNTVYTNSSSTTTNTTNNTITQTIYYGPNGGSARIISNGSNGQYVIEISDANGRKVVYSSRTNTAYTNGSGQSITDTIYYGPNGGSARVVSNGSTGQYVIEVTNANGERVVYNSSTNTAYTNASTTSITEPYYYNGYNYNYYSNPNTGGSAGSVTGPNGNTAAYATGPNGNTVAGVETQGIPASAIPYGDEDLYILKSQVVPPVCPACPSSATCPRQEPCPPCPACARCPEPSFECKKVPNYNNMNDNYLPMPVLNDFSTFGM